jgi:hypothetical protein
MKVLKDLGCIELVETVRKRGARERIYRAVELPIVSAEEWERLSPSMRQSITIAILRLISNDLAVSLGTGKIDELPDRHMSRTPLKLDREGWSELVKILARTLDEVLGVGARSLGRIEDGDETAMSVTVALLQFPTLESEHFPTPEDDM